MPNECSNNLSIYGPEADVHDFVQRVEAAGSITDAFLPFPAELSGDPITNKDGQEIARAFTNAGLQWALKNWGTKWGDYDTEILAHEPGHAAFLYTTAWGPLDAGLLNISAQFPTLVFSTVHEEPGNMILGGAVYAKGHVINAHEIPHSAWPTMPDTDEWVDALDDYNETMENLRDQLWSDLETPDIHARIKKVTA
jgi:hypothetical protein